MNPIGPSEEVDIVKKDEDIGGLVEQEVLPRRDFGVWIEEESDRFDERASLDGHTRTDGEPAKNVKCRATITLWHVSRDLSPAYMVSYQDTMCLLGSEYRGPVIRASCG